MEYFGLFIEIIFLAIGVYIYLFAAGFLRFKDPEKAAKAEAFRAQNGRWLRLLGLAMAAINLVNVFFHLQHLFATA